MIVCVCHRISDRDIARAAREGCANFDELQLELSVATSCGACRDCAHKTFHQHLPERLAAVSGGSAAHIAHVAVCARHDVAPAPGA